jgi:AcrR family transcriptional regulator
VTREAILDAVDTGGETFTMAGLASQLNVSEPAIYYHFPSKEALLVELGARVLGELQLPDRALDWEPWLEQFARGLMELYQQHRALHDVDMTLIIASQPAMVRLVDQALGQLVRHGFPLPLAAVALQTALTVVQPYATRVPADVEELHATQSTLRDIALVADAPLAAALYDDAKGYDVETVLQQQMRIVMTGIRAELEGTTTRRGRSKRSSA